MDDARVTAVTVGDKLEEERTLVTRNPVLRPLGRLVNSDDIHSVHLNTRDEISAFVVLGVHRATLRRGTHAVLVVFTNEDAGEVPELRLHRCSEARRVQ